MKREAAGRDASDRDTAGSRPGIAELLIGPNLNRAGPETAASVGPREVHT